MTHEVDLATEELSLHSMDVTKNTDEALTLDEEDRDDYLAAGNIKRGKTASDSATLALSDEALSMLIDNTNHELIKRRKLLVFSILTVSIGILLAAGIFYYQDMQEKIHILEGKHQIAMQAIAAKTDNENTPQKSEIIHNLVTDTDVEEKASFAKQQLTADKATSQAEIKANNRLRANKTQNIKATAAALSIQKTQKTDPVGEKLETAWLAYKNTRYGEAAILYKSVLLLEENNRDALLGLAAIAVIDKNYQAAKNIYLALLEQDPRDPFAIAALASLSDKEFSLADKEFLLSALQKNPNAHQLNFALGNIYAQQNNWKSAQQYYFNAWQHNNENADYIFNLAVSMDQLGKQKQALRFYEDSLLMSKNKQVGFSRTAVKKRISELSDLQSDESS